MARVFGDKELQNIQRVFESKRLGWVPDGMVTKLDAAFARFTGARYGICRNSAMTGLAQAVAISGAGCGDEVICDPLVHFGLCYGARGAPKLRPRSYTAYDVDRQLDDAAREYLRDDRNVKLNKITQHLTVPLVFRQYPTDFEPKGVAEFVSRYFPEKREQVFVASRRLTLEDAYFDWRVNALEEKPDKGKPEAAAGQKSSGSGKPKAGEKQGKGKVWSSRDGEWKDK